MRLKSLELVGFKSFLDQTVISFSPGVTAVVGPNGCGKSNVVDAIRWVLGEQAPTRLRGKSADDLMYAGNDANAAAGMAEVTLLLEAEDQSLLPEPYTTLSEVAVTRRVYRSGDSEYLLNRIPCRLKDITEFFMAAQIHSRGYALIEQGRIEEIIQAKPSELRGLVEEAAGLSLFKGRREMSERKLERVKENLARVDDVLSEIERQLNFARRQAKKAEAFKLIRSELGELEKLAAARRLRDQHALLAGESAHELELRAQAEQSRAALAVLEDDSERLGARLQTERNELAAAGRELENLRTTAAERARTRGFIERRLQAIDGHEPELLARMGELETKAVASRAARANAGARLARELNAGGGASEESLRVLRAEHDSADRTRKECERRLEAAKDELAEVVREAAVIRSRLGDFTGERSELDERAQTAAHELPWLRTTLEQTQVQLAEALAALVSVREELQGLEAVRRETADREIEARSAADHGAQQLANARQALTAATARAAERITPNGAGERLSAVLESLNGDGPAARPSFLLEVMKAPAALESALRAVLGDQLESVIVESPHFALRAIDVLKEKQGGRLSFIPDSVAAAQIHQPLAAPGINGRLIDLLEVDPRYRTLAEAVIGHVMVAADLRSALAAANANGIGTVFVTLEGDLFCPERIISGGSGERQVTHELLLPPKLADSVEAAAQRVAEAEFAQAEFRGCFEQARAARISADQAFEAGRASAAAAERAAGEARNAVARDEQRFALAEASLGAGTRRLQELAEIIAASNTRLEQLAHLEQAGRTALATVSAEAAGWRTAAEQAGAAMLAMANRVEARKALIGTLEQELRHLRQLAEEIERQIDQSAVALERSRLERVECLGELEKLATQEQAASARIDELGAVVEEMELRCAGRARELEAARMELKHARETLAEVETQAVECGLKRERARTLIEELERSFAEKFEAEFVALADEFQAALAGRDREADDARLVELRGKAERLGEVNLAAESEVKELEERAGALTSERADLQRAVNDLQQTIQKLNREARKRFAETFAGAATNFAELFPKLLRGGKGRLELTDADDVLEAGVNILVQPAGKKVKEIGLLSGGEKALSAMALVFSLFLLNPSPFCVMDEVDAPLDEFSLAQFTALMQELKARSQFIVITHNQRTMQAADHIHGVTMDRPGVSRIISLKIPQAA